MKNRKHQKCFACFHGPEYACTKTKRVPRKVKKEIKRFEREFWEYTTLGATSTLCGHVTRCDVAYWWKHIKKWLPIEMKYRRYLPALKFIREYLDTTSVFVDEAPVITKNGRLGYYWEYDNGLYCEEGFEPIDWMKGEDSDGWQYEEAVGFLKSIGYEGPNPTSDFEFLETILSQIPKVGVPKYQLDIETWN